MKVKELIDVLKGIEDQDAIVAFSDDVVGNPEEGIVISRYFTFIPETIMKDNEPVATTREIEGINFLVMSKSDVIMVESNNYSEEDPMLATYRINTLLRSKNMMSAILSNQNDISAAGFEYIPNQETGENYADDETYRLIRIRDIYTKYEYSFRCKLEKDDEGNIVKFYDLETKLDNDIDLV